MFVTELRTKTFSYLGTVAVITLILMIIPMIVDAILQAYQMKMDSAGAVVMMDNTSSMTPMALTASTVILNLVQILKIVLGMAIVVLSVRYVNFLVFRFVLRNSGQTEVASLFRSILSIIVCIVAFFIIFQSQYPTVQLAPLFTGSTILGIVVGLALQDTLGNLFAGIALQADQPFQIGDVVKLQQNNNIGVVEQVSWRGVKIRTFQNKILVISNSVLGKEIIEVAPRDNLNARLIFFNTLYSNSPARTIHILREAVRQCENVSPKIRPIVRIRNLGDNGIDWEVKYWIEDYSKFNDTDALIRQRIWYAFQREGIHFAYPTRTVYLQKEEELVTSSDEENELFDVIAAVSLFAPLSDEEIESIVKSVGRKVFTTGEKIVRRGQEAFSMFVIRRGMVRVQITTDERTQELRTLGSGEFFGEMGLFTGEPRTATVIATEETEVLEITHTCLKPILEANPELVERFGAIIAERRERLTAASSIHETDPKADRSGVFNSIRKFFGLRNSGQ